MRRPERFGQIATAAGLAALYALLLYRFDFHYVFTDTVLTGGDSASWYQVALHLKEVLLPNLRLYGWDQDNFFGYPNFQYYFIPPFLIAVVMSYVIPLTVALKLVTIAGWFFTPLGLFWALRKMRYPAPVPLIGAWSSLIFLFHERFFMFGGNLLSTLAGEFCYSVAFLLQILFMGLLFGDMQSRKRPILNGAVLGLIGLTHAFVFLTAVLMPLYFLLHRDDFAERFKYIALVYLMGFLTMAFWVIPMLAGTPYTTAIDFVWRFFTAEQFFQTVHIEVLSIAAVAGVLNLIPVFRRLHGPFFLYMIAVSAFWYVTATTLKVPDIRFFPPLLFFGLMLIVDAVAIMLAMTTGGHQRIAASAAIGLAVVLGGAWLYQGEHGPSTFAWNYAGYENKPAFRDGTMDTLQEALRGDISDGRIAWEHAAYDDDFGSDRVFESLPLFTGRPTTEGIHYASALLSKTITTLHGEHSMRTGSPSPVIYSHYDISILPARFTLFNITDIIVATPEITEQLTASPRFEQKTKAGRYTVFTLKDYEPHYVEVPAVHPLLVTLDGDWRTRFHNWFRRGEALDTLLVPESFVTPADKQRRFAASRAALDPNGVLRDGTRVNLPSAHIEDEYLDDFTIRFRTDRPGLPHLIKVAYSPNWRAVGGEAIYPASPGLMLIFPETNTVELRYGRSAAEYVGWALTLCGLVLMFAARARPGLSARIMEMAWLHRLAQKAAAVRPIILTALGVGAVAVAAFSYQGKTRFFNDYMAGNALTAEGRYNEAVQRYARAATPSHIADIDNGDIANSLYGMAHAYKAMGRNEDAAEAYRRVIKFYPRWLWIHQVHFNLGETELTLGHREAARHHFARCLQIDPYSDYAPRCRQQLDALD